MMSKPEEKRCVLNPNKICDDCGECDDRCELDPTKICDNCMKCVYKPDADYLEIQIDKIFTEALSKEDEESL